MSTISVQSAKLQGPFIPGGAHIAVVVPKSGTSSRYIAAIYQNGGAGNQWTKMAEISFSVSSNVAYVQGIAAGYYAGDQTATASSINNAWALKTSTAYGNYVVSQLYVTLLQGQTFV